MDFMNDKFFEECYNIVKDRQNDYGDSKIMANKIIGMFNTYYGLSLPSDALYVLMILIKLTREGYSKKLDNCIDGANYFRLLANK